MHIIATYIVDPILPGSKTTVEKWITTGTPAGRNPMWISGIIRPVGRGVHVHPPFFSLIIACHFTEILNYCMSNRLRLHAILSISLTKPHLVQLINISLDTYELWNRNSYRWGLQNIPSKTSTKNGESKLAFWFVHVTVVHWNCLDPTCNKYCDLIG